MASLPKEAKRNLSEQEIEALYPKDLILQYVQIFFRHGLAPIVQGANKTGERTPVKRRLMQAGIPPYWDLCKAADEFRAAALSEDGVFESLHYSRKLERPEENGRVGHVNQDGNSMWYYPLYT